MLVVVLVLELGGVPDSDVNNRYGAAERGGGGDANVKELGTERF